MNSAAKIVDPEEGDDERNIAAWHAASLGSFLSMSEKSERSNSTGDPLKDAIAELMKDVGPRVKMGR